jgi:hypothetical protein
LIGQKISKKLGKLKLVVIVSVILFFLFTSITFFAFYGLNSLFGLTSSNSFIYIIKHEDGIKFKTDIDLSEVDNLLFMIDFSCLFSIFERVAVAVSDTSIMELTWDTDGGRGIIKEIRPDGSKFIVVLSRYYDDVNVTPNGLFIGGDLPYGDFDRWLDRSGNNTGIAYYNGDRWYHIWCSINEGLSINGIEKIFYPRDWYYEGSRVVKKGNEIILESYHTLSPIINGVKAKLFMKRTLFKRIQENYVFLKIDIKNTGTLPLSYNFAFGDEPWVGDFGDSRGDIGWYSNGVFKKEGFLSPKIYRYAGFWDAGNDLAGEKGPYSKYANFIEWLNNSPNYVYFSNRFEEVKESKILDSWFNRIINLLWVDQKLMPGESKTYELALGMAMSNPLNGFPLKPHVKKVY